MTCQIAAVLQNLSNWRLSIPYFNRLNRGIVYQFKKFAANLFLTSMDWNDNMVVRHRLDIESIHIATSIFAQRLKQMISLFAIFEALMAPR